MQLIKSLVSWFKHVNCMICESRLATSLGICDFCKKILPWIDKSPFRCIKCLTILEHQQLLLCELCQNKQQSFKIFAIFAYLPPISNIILSLKFGQKLRSAKFLSNILLEFVQARWYNTTSLPDAVIPVPLHLKKLRRRGFNQAVVLADALKPIMKVDHNSCFRIKNTTTQSKLLQTQRPKNLRHAFNSTVLPYKHIAILDDVITTGSTINSLAQTIKHINPNIIIDIWAIART